LIFSVLVWLFCSLVRSHTYVCSLSHSQNASPDRKISARSNKNQITILRQDLNHLDLLFPDYVTKKGYMFCE